MNPQLLTAALAAFSPDAVAQYIASRPIMLDRYFLARFLPPVQSTDADIRDGSIRVLSGIAGVTAPDSPYAKVGGMKAVEFTGSTIKLTAETTVTERDQRVLISRVNQTILNGGSPAQTIQAFLSRMFADGTMLSLDNAQEYYRALALATGKITGSYNGITLNVDYGVPTANILTPRTGTARYNGSASKWWDDVESARTVLAGGEPQFITNPATANAIIGNGANNMIVVEREILGDWLTRYVVQQKTTDGIPTQDVRYRITIWAYGGYAENEGGDRTYFWPDGRVTAVLPGVQRVDLIDGQIVDGALGVTHVGPNIELGGNSGRFGRIFRPEGALYQVLMQGTENVLPHIREPRRAVFMQTALA